MFTAAFNPRQFLRSVYGTEPFIEYCQKRGIAFDQMLGWLMHDEDYDRWLASLRALPEGEQTKIELELAQVNEMGHADAIPLLMEAVSSRQVPPDTVPGGEPLSLWCYLRHTHLFREAFLQREIGEVESWRTAHVPPGVAMNELRGKQEALAESLREFFRASEGTGRFCAVESYRLDTSCCFIAYLSDRLRLFDVFTDDGEHRTRAARPAFAICFVYYPADGRVLLKTRRRSREKIVELIQRFGQAVLGRKLNADCLAPIFRLELLKKQFELPPDAPDMESVRVKALHLAHAERNRRRRVKLETLPGDSRFAILELLRQHGGGAEVLDELQVIFAELQVRLREEARARNYSIRLWRDRCSLNQTPLGERLYSCLQRWGIADAAKP